MDYTDMVEDFLLADYSFETDYFIVDEAQRFNSIAMGLCLSNGC